MIRFNKLAIHEPVYTWIADDGRNVHLASERLRQWVIKANLEIELAPIDHELALSFISRNTVSVKRLKQLATEVGKKQRTLDPVILCKRGTYTNGGPDVMLADGHHRYTLAALIGQIYVPCFLLEVNQWRRFQIVGAPDMTDEMLERIPIRERNY